MKALSLRSKILVVGGIILCAGLVLMPFLAPLSGAGGADWVTAIGRFHIIVLHFPICLLLVVPLLELLGAIRPMHYFKQAIPSVLLLATLFAAGACVLGFLLASGEGDAGSLVDDHMWGGILTTVIMAVALIIYELNPPEPKKATYAAYLTLLMASVVSLTIGSHHGASLVHGEDYLYEKAPQVVKTMIGVEEEMIVALSDESSVYHDVIDPIFLQHCHTCHSELKEKGQFKMDSFAALLAGGKSEHPGVVPGELEESEIYKRIILPQSDDKAMPPEEKAPLSESEIALIEWWIEGGASDSITIGELSFQSYPKKIETIVTSLIAASEPSVEPLELETYLTISRKLKEEYEIDVVLRSQDLNNGVEIVARGTQTAIPAKAFRELEVLAPHVISINLWRREIDPEVYAEVATFFRLTSLHLSESSVNADGLAHLSGLRKLKTLNLFGTEIGDDAMDQLAQIRSLRKVHLNNSQVSVDGVTKLQSLLPRCEVLYHVEIPEA